MRGRQCQRVLSLCALRSKKQQQAASSKRTWCALIHAGSELALLVGPLLLARKLASSGSLSSDDWLMVSDGPR